jgi:SAM-dependent methyltransferase
MLDEPGLYHLHHANETEDIGFWLQLAREYGEPLLELGCGTGRLLLPLAEAGFSVFGLDVDYPSLAYLRDSLGEALRPKVNYFQCSIDQFHLSQEFPMIFLACNTLSALPELIRKQAYQRIYAHLEPGGIFAASLPNPDYLKSLPVEGELEVEDILYHPHHHNPIQVSSGWQRTSTKILFYWHYDQLLPDGKVIRKSIKSEQFIIDLRKHLDELRSANLEPYHLYGDFDGSEYDRESPYLIFLARKDN